MEKYLNIMFNNQKGQTMLIVVLAIVIALTVGLSVASRSIVGIKTATEEANSQKALAAAEAGIERALQKLTETSSIDGAFELGEGTESTYSTSVASLSGRLLVLNGGNMVKKDEGIDLWFVSHNEDGTPDYLSSWSGDISVYWGEQGDECSQSQLTNTMAAVEIVVIEGTKDAPLLRRYVYDPCSTRRDVNNFDLADAGKAILGKTFSHGKTNIEVNQAMLAKVIPLYANAPVAIEVTSGSDLPSQGSVISSIGKSGTTERKVTVFQGYPTLPAEFFPNNFFYHNL